MNYPNKRFWFYNNWDGGFAKASDEYGHHTIVIPLGKERAFVLAYRSGYKKFKHCEFCAQSRKQTLDFYQELYYIQTYHNIEDFDDVYDLDNELWDEALGV